MRIVCGLYHPAAAEPDQPVRHRRKRGIVGDQQNGDPFPPAGVLQQLQNLFPGHIVERSRGLIAEQQLRILGERPCDGDTLLLASGKLRREIAGALL